MRRRRASGAPPHSLLSTTELGARRIVWRRRRARRRLAVALVLLLAVAAIAVIPRLQEGSGRAAPVTHASVGPPPPVVRHRASRPVPSAAKLYAPVDRVLAYTSYVRLGAGRRREVALTFDDGPGPYTSPIIRLLHRTHTPATFFVIGRQVPTYRGVVAAEARDGFEIGDHTESHPFLAVLPAAVQREQVAAAARTIQDAGAPYPRLFRPPYGSFNASTLAVLHAARMLIVLWSADTSDYARPGVARIVYVALSGLRPGAIILMHDGGGNRSETLQALPLIIRGLHHRGYRAVTISQLLADDPPPRAQPAPRPLSGAG